MLRSIILRFVLPLALASAVVAYFAMPHIDQMLAEWFRGDIELRASLIEGSMEERLADLVSHHDKAGVRKYLSRVASDQRISAILVCDADGALFYRTAPTADEISCSLSAAPNPGASQIIRLSSGAMHVAGFQIADRFRVFQHLQPPLQPFDPRRVNGIVLRRVVHDSMKPS